MAVEVRTGAHDPGLRDPASHRAEAPAPIRDRDDSRGLLKRVDPAAAPHPK